MKTIKINFIDFWNGFNIYENDFTICLKKRYNVEISENPDYIFYSTFGQDHTKYKCIKIFYTGECLTPNFNLCDYAIGFDYLTFGDRYLRYPLYKLFQYRDNLLAAIKRESTYKKKQFCCFLYSNDNGMHYRKDFFIALSKYKKIDSGGRFLNNIGYAVDNKDKFLQNYKFCIAFENCIYDGYTTEKIVDAFSAGTIPIYLGNPSIEKEFNNESFINCHAFKNFDEAIQAIIKIDSSDELYSKMISSRISDRNLLDQSVLNNFLYNIFDQDIDNAFRRPQNTYIKQCNEYDKFISFFYKKYFLPKKRILGFIRRLKNKSLLP